MPEPQRIGLAEMREVRLGNADQATEVINHPAKTVEVQFNPETLKVNYSNQIDGGDQTGGSALQFIAKSSTKLALELWFDVTVDPDHNDVRKVTEKVAYFIRPQRQTVDGEEKMVPPAVRFIWGSFLFDGIVESMDETLEFFSEDGRPLRASVSLSVTSQDIQFQYNPDYAGPGTNGSTPGTQPTETAREGDSVAGMLGRTGGNVSNWPKVAEAHDLESGLHIQAGTPINLNVKVNV